MQQSPSNQLRKYVTYFLSAGLFGSLLSPCCLVFTAQTIVRQGQTGFIVLGVIGSALGFIIASLGFGALWWSRGHASEVDDLLEGRNLLAYWDYKVDEHGQLQKGYVYIGRSGVYKDGIYFHFEGKGRRLIEVTYTKGPPSKIIFTCTQRSGKILSFGRKSFPQIAVPVPLDKEHLAAGIVRKLKPG
jgi:hypothetical protein